MKIIECIVVNDLSERTRLYDYLAKNSTTLLSRKGAKKALKKGRIQLNTFTVTGSEFLKIGDEINIIEEESIVKKVFPLKLHVCYEDEFLAIVEKPAGIPTSGNYYKTLLNALPFNLSISREKDALPCPLPIHRLDQLTSGLVIIAKTYSVRIKLGEMLEKHTIKKTYRAVVHGEINGYGLLDSLIDGKTAYTSYCCLASFETKRFGRATLLELLPITGRTHQLRIHLSRLGFPIFGDKTYKNYKKTTMDKGLFLQAFSLSFMHPVTNKKIQITIEEPNKFKWLLKN